MIQRAVHHSRLVGLLCAALAVATDPIAHRSTGGEAPAASITSTSEAEDLRLNLSPDFDHAPFLHGVASADPFTDSVLLWTRVTPDDGTPDTDGSKDHPPRRGADEDDAAPSSSVRVSWSIWEGDDYAQSYDNPHRRGVAETGPELDYTLQIDVDGLKPGISYRYQFGVGNRRSMVGTTKTASTEGEEANVAVISCTSLWSGYFHAYRHMADDDSLDVVVHLGDYIYPEVDPQETLRLPHGLHCDDWEWPYDWFRPSKGTKDDNPEGFVRDYTYAIDCSSTLLERYRWVYALYMLDPDLRAARARHPFVVTLDNHELFSYDASRLPVDAARQAALEWVPQRTRIETSPEGTPFVSTLRNFRFGNNLIDVVMLDTHCYSGNQTSKEKHGLLGDGQHKWLDDVLTNSSSDDVTWRVLGSAKSFMPMVLNKFATATIVPFGPPILVISIVLAACLACEILYFSAYRALSQYEEDYEEEAVEAEDDMPYRRKHTEDKDVILEYQREEARSAQERASRSRLHRIMAALPSAHAQSPRPLRWFTACSFALLSLTTMLWIISAAYLKVAFSTHHHEINYLHAEFYTWEGQVGSTMRLFDQLEATGTDSNNVWVTGDMHYTFASDVFRFDPDDVRSILKYSPRRQGFKRYGVEMLPASGTRGNLDESLGGKFFLLRPGRLLSRLVCSVLSRMVMAMNKHYRYFEGTEHGYGVLRVERSIVRATIYQFPILKRSTNRVKVGRELYIENGDNRWTTRRWQLH